MNTEQSAGSVPAWVQADADKNAKIQAEKLPTGYGVVPRSFPTSGGYVTLHFTVCLSCYAIVQDAGNHSAWHRNRAI